MIRSGNEIPPCTASMLAALLAACTPVSQEAPQRRVTDGRAAVSAQTESPLRVVRSAGDSASVSTASSGIASGESRESGSRVHIVTSARTYQGIRGLARQVSATQDAHGTLLTLAEVDTSRLGDISAYVHQHEKRCGGYFAFDTLADAEAFLRTDRSAQALSTSVATVAYTIDNAATVGSWLPQVSASRIHDTIAHLSGYQNRYFTSATGKSSAEWIRAAWQDLGAGRADVGTELFTACANCSTQPSVILTIQGTTLPNEIVVLGAHLDSINRDGGGSAMQLAPGADDDASGIAVLTETLRIALASGWRPLRTVKFMGYAAEEVGLRGSNAIAQSFRTAGTNVVGVLQVDMTNYKSGPVQDMKLITDYSSTELKNFFIQLFDAYMAPLGYTRGTYTCGYGCSDHASWTAAGYPAAMMFEAGDVNGSFPYIHTTSDTLATMGNSAQHSVKFAQFALAFLGESAKSRIMRTGGPLQPTPAG